MSQLPDPAGAAQVRSVRPIFSLLVGLGAHLPLDGALDERRRLLELPDYLAIMLQRASKRFFAPFRVARLKGAVRGLLKLQGPPDPASERIGRGMQNHRLCIGGNFLQRGARGAD